MHVANEDDGNLIEPDTEDGVATGDVYERGCEVLRGGGARWRSMDDGSTVAEVWDGGSTNVGVPCDCPRRMKAISILKGKETKRPMDAFTK